MVLDDLDGMANVSFTVNVTETVTWETTSDWDNATAEQYMKHPSGTMEMAPGIDSFEDIANGTATPGWTINYSSSITNNVSGSDGSKAAANGGSGEATTLMYVDGVNHAPETVSMAYYETQSSGGGEIRFLNENGNEIMAMGSGNPQMAFRDGNGQNCLESNSDYETWYRFTVTFDWANDTFDILWEDTSGSFSDVSDSGIFYNSSTEISRVEYGTSQEYLCGGQRAGGADDSWLDELYGGLTESHLTTATKSFSSSVEPDLQNLEYTMNSQTISLDVTGSPGTASEETVTQTLDGSSSYALTWSAAHTDFEVTANMSSSDRETSPNLGRVELVA